MKINEIFIKQFFIHTENEADAILVVKLNDVAFGILTLHFNSINSITIH